MAVCLSSAEPQCHSHCYGVQVRDSLGLTYDVNFDLPLFDRLQESWYVVVVTSTPQKIQQALEASVGVMRTLTSQRISVRELARAQRTLLTRHESETKASCCLCPLQAYGSMMALCSVPLLATISHLLPLACTSFSPPHQWPEASLVAGPLCWCADPRSFFVRRFTHVQTHVDGQYSLILCGAVLQDNAFWLRQLTHLQNDAVPLKRLECLRDYKRCMESATVDDLYDALKCFKVDDNSIFTVIGTSGSSPPPPRGTALTPAHTISPHACMRYVSRAARFAWQPCCLRCLVSVVLELTQPCCSQHPRSRDAHCWCVPQSCGPWCTYTWPPVTLTLLLLLIGDPRGVEESFISAKGTHL